MSYYLNNDIRHTMAYNPGGIVMVYLLDINDFVTYRFKDDGLFEKGYVEKIKTKVLFNEIDTNSDSDFSETQENGIYKQELKAYVGTLTADKLSDLLKTVSSRFLVGFRTLQNRYYCFGSDGGASVKFSQLSGKEGEGAGYQLTFSKDSVYPLFEIDGKAFNRIKVLGTEDRRIAMTEDFMNAILLSELYGHDWPDPLPDVEPDRYEDLPKNERTVFHRQRCKGYEKVYYGYSVLDYDIWVDDKKDPDGNPIGYYLDLEYDITDDMAEQLPKDYSQFCYGTYKVVDCDEISVFAQPFRIHTSLNRSLDYRGISYSGLDIRQNGIDNKLLPGLNVKLQNFDTIYGGYYPRANDQVTGLACKDHWDLFTDRSMSKNISEGWDVMSVQEFLQLVGQAPHYNTDIFENIKDFFCLDAKRDIVTSGGFSLTCRANISGLGFTPGGICEPTTDEGIYEQPVKVYAFGKISCLALKEKKFQFDYQLGGISDTTDIAGWTKGVYICKAGTKNDTLAHGGNIRYSRTKTAEELGYRLYVDEKADRVLMIDLDDDQPRLPELPTGLERGITLRYANRAERIIVKGWRNIQEEAKEISKIIQK